MFSFSDATVAMRDATLSVTEDTQPTVSVCVVSGIAGNIELPLTALLQVSSGAASKLDHCIHFRT